MKSIIKLKEQARTHEQKEAWEKAIASYREILRLSEEQEGEAELPLFNKIGDLYLRLGRSDDAVEQYEQAADRYAEAGLYNNAIALCNKALRHAPGRLEVYLRLGRFCAAQGFLADARRWILEYAEKVGAAVGPEEAFEALEEFAQLTNDPEIGEMLGQRLMAHGRADEALVQLRRAYRLYADAGRTDRAEAVRAAVEEIDPDASLDDGTAGVPPLPTLDDADEEAFDADSFGALDLESAADSAGIPAEQTDEAGPADEPLTFPAGPGAESDALPEAEESLGEFGMIDIGLESPAEASGHGGATDPDAAGFGTLDLDGADLQEADEVAPEPLPLLEGTEEEAGDGGFDLPLLDAAPEEERSEPAVVIDVVIDVEAGRVRARERLARGDKAAAIRELDDLHVGLAEAGRFGDALDVVAELIALEPSRVRHYQLRVEYASRTEAAEPLVAAYLELAGVLEERGAATQARAVLQRVLDLEPDNERARAGLYGGAPVRSREYVDLTAFLGDALEAQHEPTRMVVAAQEPSGDEDRDFAEMLSQFRAKVADTVSVEDAASHYDLGLAFREMGLVDEAIHEFQTALRGGEERLKVYEELGRCFVLKGQYNVAVKILSRALQLPREAESELLGVYYHLGLCYEELGQRGEARDAYERVIGLHVDFRDVPGRLARL